MSHDLTLPPPPSRTGGIVRSTFALVREHGAFAGMAVFVLALPLSMLRAYLSRNLLDEARASLESGTPMGDGVEPLVELLDGLIVAPWMLGAAVLLLAAQSHSVRRALRMGLRRLPRVLGAMLLGALISMLPLLPAFIALAAGVDGGLAAGRDIMRGPGVSGPGADLPAGLGLAGGLALLGLVPSMFLGLSFGLTLPLAALDRMAPVAALRVSWERMGGQRLRLLGGMLGTTILVGFVLSIAVAPLGLLALAALSAGSVGSWVVLGGLGDAVLTTGIMLLMAGVVTVVYRDTTPAPPLEADEAGEPAPA